MVELFANSGDPDLTPRSAASDLGLHCLPPTLLEVCRLQCVKERTTKINILDLKTRILDFLFVSSFANLNVLKCKQLSHPRNV